MSNTLFVVATPIGNLSDISPRAIEILRSVDFVACEDTRHTKKLLSHFSIKANAISFHGGSNTQKILDILNQGKSVALVSDAGTPAISDPGSRLVSDVKKAGFIVSAIPGPSAIISALSASGLDSSHFEFFGFIPHKKGREKLLKQINELEHTAVFYESTHRIIKCLTQMSEFFEPNRQIVIARELTKVHEEFLSGTPNEILEILINNTEKQRGEFVVLVTGNY